MPQPRKSSHGSIYLSKLRFDPKLRNSLLAKYLTNFRYVFLLILIITIVGLFGYLNLPRRVNPEIKIPIVSVSTVLPGANPSDVESLITVPIEDSLTGLPDIDTITSISSENISIITMQFNSGVDPEKARDRVKAQVDTVTNLPTDAKDPNVLRFDFENQPVWQFIVTSKGDTASLTSFAEDLKEKVKKVPSIKEVTLTGNEKEEIQILIRPEVQKSYGIDANVLSAAIRSAIPAYPSGSLNTENSSFSLSVDSTLKSVEDLRNLEILINGNPIRLFEIAEVSLKSSPNQAPTYWADPKNPARRAVAFSVFKSESANIDKAVSEARKVVETEVGLHSNQFSVVSILDTAKLVDDQFNDVLKSFRDTIILVVITLLIFLGLRQALIVAFSIPLSFLVAFTVMNLMGLSINFLTLFSLILALGLLVDDAIVVVTAMTAYWRSHKFTPEETGLLVLKDFTVPIWSTTITAVWAFAPLLLATGIIGEFIKSIPIVVSTTLLASTAIAIVVTLPLMVFFLKPSFPKRIKYLFYGLIAIAIFAPVYLLTATTLILPIAILLFAVVAIIFIRTRKVLVATATQKLHGQKTLKAIASRFHQYSIHGIIDSQKFAASYEDLIIKVISSKSARRKTLAIVIIFALFSYLLIPLGFVVNEFFPKTDEDQLYVSVELPAGTNLETARAEALKIIGDLRQTPYLDFVTTQVGQSFDSQSGSSSQAGASNTLFTINLQEDRKQTSFAIADILRAKYRSYAKGKVSVIEASGGPPAGSDIQIKLVGEDLTVLNTYADKISEFLKKQDGINNVEKSIKPGTSRIVFIPNRKQLVTNQISEGQIGNALRSFTTGQTLSTDVKFESTKKDIILRQKEGSESPQNLSTLSVQNPLGVQIPLTALGRFELSQNPTQITREGGQRTISVSAGVTKGFPIPQLSTKLEAYAKSDLNLPQGYEWKTGGVNEENQNSVNSIMQAMVLAFLLIAATMVLQFGSYRKAFIVLMLIPLAISGVFVVFAITGTPLSFPTLIGMLALFGIVVYQAMMIVDKINKNQKFGMNLKQSIAEAGASRVEPILFGTLTTVMGLIPITLSDPLWRGLGGAIISGMLFSGTIMLLFVPVVYYEIYKHSEGR